MLKKSRYNPYQNTIGANTFIWQWSLNALGFVLLTGLVTGIGAAFLPFSCFLISCCLGVGAEAIGWVLPIALMFTGVGAAAVIGHYIGQRQQKMLEQHLSVQLQWRSATQYGLMVGFGFASLLLMPLIHYLSPTPGDMTCCILVIVVILPLISLAIGIAQWLQLRRIVNHAWHWISVQVLSALMLSTILLISVQAALPIRLLSVVLMLLCLGILKRIMGQAWYSIITHLAVIAFVSSVLWLIGDDILLFMGVKPYVVDTAFSLLYTIFLVGALSLLKAHIGASVLLDIWQRLPHKGVRTLL